MYNCALKVCLLPIKPEVDFQVKVRSISINESVKQKTFHANWNKNGEAVFHKKCWDCLRTNRLSAEERKLVKEAIKTAEFQSSFREIHCQAVKFYNLLTSSKHFVSFTGAGISTAAGIGDYRGINGKWTQEDRQEKRLIDESEDDEDDGVDYETLRPTLTHEILAYLALKGTLKHIISQNGDGLHSLSGLNSNVNLSELHGNVFVERCEKCLHRYNRDHYVMDDTASSLLEDLFNEDEPPKKKRKNTNQIIATVSKQVDYPVRICSTCKCSHRTGRRCTATPGCSGYLMDTIINFGDDLEADVLTRAQDEAKQADLMLCLGSTLRVTPAAYLTDPQWRERKKSSPIMNLVICNRQITDLDNLAIVRVFGDCDTFMAEVGRLVMGEATFKQWITNRKARLKHYDKRRNVT